MASEPAMRPTQPEASQTEPPGQPVVNLVVLSPSVGVPQPLRLPELPTSTTIKQLKEKIRDTLPTRPTEENQRLIHRGRALVRDAESLLEIFGAEAVSQRSTTPLKCVETNASMTRFVLIAIKRCIS